MRDDGGYVKSTFKVFLGEVYGGELFLFGSQSIQVHRT